MSKCLITKLSGIVQNHAIIKLGELSLIVHPSDKSVEIDTTINCECYTPNNEKIFTTDNINFSNVAESHYFKVKAKADTEFRIPKKYDNECLLVRASNIIDSVKCVNGLSYMSSLKYLEIINIQNFIDNISELRTLKKLNRLSLINTKISGDVADLQDFNLSSLILSGSKNIKGDVAALANMRNVTSFIVYTTSLYGNINSFKERTDIQALNLAATNVNGNIEELVKLVNLKEIIVDNTSIEGDFKLLCEGLHSNGKTTGTLKFNGNNSNVKIDSNNSPNNDVIATFSEEGVSYSGI